MFQYREEQNVVDHEARNKMLNIISRNTIEFRIQQWIDNFKANLPNVQGGLGIASLLNKLPNIPAIIVGSGPTLDWNGRQLQLYQDKACIISCDSAVKALLSFNVKPHIILTTDSKARVAKFFADIDTSQFIFVVDTFCHPETVAAIKGKKYWYSTLPVEACPFTSALNRWHGYIGNLGTGGCVATTAWWLACRLLMTDPTILVGLPQAFYDPSAMYARAVENTIETEPYQAEIVVTKDIYGRQCFTYPALQSFTYWFEDAFFQTPGMHINCSEGGIISRNILNMPLIEAGARYMKTNYDIKKMITINETVVDEMIIAKSQYAEKLNEYRNLMVVLLDGPSIGNLSLRMGRTEQQIVEIAHELRGMGFIINESTNIVANPEDPRQTIEQLVFQLTGYVPDNTNVVTEISNQVIPAEQKITPKEEIIDNTNAEEAPIQEIKEE